MNAIKLFAVNTGSFALDGGAMFGRVPKPLWEKQYPADARNRIPLALRCLLIKWDGNRALLVDTGIGDKWSDKNRDIYDIRPNPQAWDAAKTKPEEITDVLLTHNHFDHAGGATKYASNSAAPSPGGEAARRVVPTFPRAKYHMGREHRAYLREPSLLDRASYLAENLDPLEQAGQLELTDPPLCQWPHMKLFEFTGHTNGLVLPLINVGSKTIFFGGDLVPTKSHVRLAWIMGYDTAPMQTLEEKRFVLESIADNQWGLFLEHDINVELVTVKRDKDDFAVDRTWRLDEFISA